MCTIKGQGGKKHGNDEVAGEQKTRVTGEGPGAKTCIRITWQGIKTEVKCGIQVDEIFAIFTATVLFLII
jgi:hypothetical protein